MNALLRYGIVGVTQNGAAFLANLALISIGLPAWIAVLIVTPAAILATFYANRLWSFSDRKTSEGQIRKYIAVYGTAWAVMGALVWALERGGIPAPAAILLAMATNAVGIFLALNTWVFPRSERAS